MALVAAVVVGTGVLVGGAAWTFGPRSGDAAPAEVLPADPEHARTAELLASVLVSGRGIVAIHPAGTASPFLEVVVCAGTDPRRAEDLALLTYHPRMERVFLYAVAEDAAERDLAAVRALAAEGRAGARDFPDRWRERDAVVRRTLVRDLVGMEIEDLGPGEGGRTRLVLRLRWPAHRTDGNDEARIPLEVVRIED